MLRGNFAFDFSGDGNSIDHTTDTHITDNIFYAHIDPISRLSNTTSRSLVINTLAESTHIKSFDGGYSGLHGFVVQNTLSGKTSPTWIFADDLLADCSFGSAWLFDSSLGSSEIGFTATNSWAAGAGQSCDGTPTIRNALADGVTISGGAGIYIHTSHIRANAGNGDHGDPHSGVACVLGRMLLCAVRETLGRLEE